MVWVEDAGRRTLWCMNYYFAGWEICLIVCKCIKTVVDSPRWHENECATKIFVLMDNQAISWKLFIKLFSNSTRSIIILHEPLHSRGHGFIERSKLKIRKVFAKFSVVRSLLKLPVSLFSNHLSVFNYFLFKKATHLRSVKVDLSLEVKRLRDWSCDIRDANFFFFTDFYDKKHALSVKQSSK